MISWRKVTFAKLRAETLAMSNKCGLSVIVLLHTVTSSLLLSVAVSRLVKREMIRPLMLPLCSVKFMTICVMFRWRPCGGMECPFGASAIFVE